MIKRFAVCCFFLAQAALVWVAFGAVPAFSKEPAPEPDEALYSVVLNDAPLLSGTAQTLQEQKTPNRQEAATVTVNPANRQESLNFFLSQYEISPATPISWTGTVSPCNAGVTSTEFKNAVAQRINYFRAMAGVPASVVMSEPYNSKDEDMALMMAANNNISHAPPTTWTCYTTNGAAAAGSSNLALGLNGWNAINAYMQDYGAANTPVGHRRWLFYPNTSIMGTGDVPSGNTNAPTNALWIFAYGGSRPSTRNPYVAWPPPGYTSYRTVYPRWSFSYPGASFVTATVGMLSGTLPLSVTQHAVVNGYGDNTLAWVPYGNDVNGYGSWMMPAVGQDLTYTVFVSNVVVSGVPKTFSYTVYIFNDDEIAPTGGITISAGADFINTTVTTVTLGATDLRGVSQMRVNTGTVQGWQYYSNLMNITLSAGEGQKWMSVQYRDSAGNTSPWYTDTIILDTTSPTGSIKINGDAVYAPSATQVNLTAFDNYSVSKVNLYYNGAWTGWLPYSSTISITLTTAGANTVLAQFKDGAGNIGPTYSDSVIADLTAPTGGGVVINGGASGTTNPVITLALTATDNLSLTQMAISQNGAWLPWEGFAISRTLTLTGGDGLWTIGVMFRDAAGNASLLYTSTILLDTTPPAGSVSINGGAAYAQTPTATLTLSATDNLGLTDMRIKVNGAWSGWLPYVSSTQVVFSGGDGSQTVMAQYRDALGNASPTYNTSIVLDSAAPSGSVLVNGGAAFTQIPTMTLALTATDNLALADMRIFANGAWGGWVSYAAWAQVVMTGADGAQLVQAQYRDAAGNVSATYADTIVLDRAPSADRVSIEGGAGYTQFPTVTISLTPTPGLTAEMRLSVNGVWGAWVTYSSTAQAVFTGGDGPQTVGVQYRNAAGDTSPIYTDTITLDSAAPSGSVLINGGAAFTQIPTMTLALTATDNLALADMRIFANGAWGGWVSYAAWAQVVMTGADGAQLVQAQYRDAAGNVSATYADTIVLDRASSADRVSIEGGAGYTQFPTATISLTPTPGLTAEMRLSVNGVWGAWVTYSSTAQAVFTGGDGPQTVGVQYRNEAGDTSPIYTDTITLDSAAPSGSVLVNGGAAFTQIPTMTLALTATDNLALADMRIFANGAWGGWVSYAAWAQVVMTGADGAQLVQAQYRDAAGNVSATYADTIVLDRASSADRVSIEGGAGYTQFPTVTISLTPTPGLTAEMRLSVNGVWGAWVTYSSTAQAVFTGGDGTQTVGVQYRNAAGDTSPIYTDTITLDSAAPSGSVLVNGGAAFTQIPTMTLALTATDNLALADMRIFANGAWGGWVSYAASAQVVMTGADGAQLVQAQYRDAAGNVSATYADTIVLDRASSADRVSIEGGAGYTQFPTVTISLTPTPGLTAEMRLSVNGVWGAWVTYSSTAQAVFTGGDGPQTVGVQYRNAAGDTSPIYTNTITLDSAAPSGSVLINGGALFTRFPTITLALTATETSLEMRFNVNGSWGGWMPFSNTAQLTISGGDLVNAMNAKNRPQGALASGDGPQTVMAQFQDAAQNKSDEMSRTITLDTTTPDTAILGLPMSASSPFPLFWSLNMPDLSGAQCYDVQVRAGLIGVWNTWNSCVTTTTASFVGEVGTTYYFRSRAVDNAGNIEDFPINPDYDTSACVDAFEPNNNAAESAFATVGVWQTHAFCETNDVDWIQFIAQEGERYTINATGITSTLDLIDADGVTVLASGVNSIAAQTLPVGAYFVRASNTSAQIGRYDVLVRMVQPLRVFYLPHTIKEYSAGW